VDRKNRNTTGFSSFKCIANLLKPGMETQTILCRCPVCKTEFTVELGELPHEYPRRDGRMIYPCNANHPLIELWQAWRQWYGVSDQP
jgi:hypothetical protein